MAKEVINEQRRAFLGTSAVALSSAVMGRPAIFSSLPLQMAFFPFEQLDTLSPRPLLVIAGSRADTLFWSQQVYNKAKDPKELFVVEGATHIDLHDRPQFVTPAVAKLKEFFGRHLSTGGSH